MRIIRAGLVVGFLMVGSSCGGNGADMAATTPPSGPITSVTSPSPTTAPSTVTPSTVAPSTVTPPTVAPSTTAPSTTAPETTPTTGAVSATSGPTTTAPSGATVDVKLYLLRGERLAIAHRLVPGPAVLRGALGGLFAGPTVDESAAGLHSEIPDGTTLLDLNLAEGIATVDVSSEFATGGGTLSMSARLAEVVFTATQFDNVDGVVFWIEGEPVEFFGGEGIVLDGPQTRNDVGRAFTDGILIDHPAPGSDVTSPFTVTGEGDVYEGDFPLEIRRDGERIGDLMIVSAGAWGEWAPFETTVTVDAPAGPIDLVALDEPGCTPDVEPNCRRIEIVVPLVLTG